MVAAGLVTANEATWLGSIRTRKLAIGEATAVRRKASGEGAVKSFAAQVVELAFVRDRIDRGFGDQRVAGAAERGGLRGVRGAGAAPTLAQMSGFRAP